VPITASARKRPPLWPAVLVTILTGMGFSGLKFVLIGEIALSFDPAHPPAMAFAWMDEVLRNAIAKETLKEAITQGLAAVLTFGVLIGYIVNAPLAGAWRVAWLFVISSAGVAAGALLTLWLNPWLIAVFVGIAYGTACAARGKVVPLLAAATGRSNTLVSGVINASLVISLLAGTVFGTLLSEWVDAPAARHVVLFVFSLMATLIGLKVSPPEPPSIPFSVGMRDLMVGTVDMLRDRWALIVGGGLAWGIASAAVLAAFIDAIERLAMKPEHAVALVIFPAVGAIIGNLASHRLDRHVHVIGGYIGLGLTIGAYQWLVTGPVSGAMVMLAIGALFAAPTNVLDARLLAFAAAQGQPGRGSTVMSLVHNVFILLIGSGLAVALFLGLMRPEDQFYSLAVVAVITGVVVIWAHLDDTEVVAGKSVQPAA
jgi:MFS family permease